MKQNKLYVVEVMDDMGDWHPTEPIVMTRDEGRVELQESKREDPNNSYRLARYEMFDLVR